ncbi:unnamed protein product, partial [Urochloa humidicola]
SSRAPNRSFQLHSAPSPPTPPASSLRHPPPPPFPARRAHPLPARCSTAATPCREPSLRTSVPSPPRAPLPRPLPSRRCTAATSGWLAGGAEHATEVSAEEQQRDILREAVARPPPHEQFRRGRKSRAVALSSDCLSYVVELNSGARRDEASPQGARCRPRSPQEMQGGGGEGGVLLSAVAGLCTSVGQKSFRLIIIDMMTMTIAC